MPAPKQASFTHAGRRITLQYKPNAPTAKRWHWRFTITSEMHFDGDAPTLERAKRDAAKQLDALNV